MFLVDTNVVSEDRKGIKADQGVLNFIGETANQLFLPVQVIGELERGVEALRQRGDYFQALRLETWFHRILETYSARVLTFDASCAQIWGRLMGPSDQNPIDKQIAAIALHYDLTVVTRNTTHFQGTGVRLMNPFLADASSAKPAL